MTLNAFLSRNLFTKFNISKRNSSNATKTKSSFNYCFDLVKKYDHENFLCSLLLPGTVRNDAVVIRAFNVEVSKAALASKDDRISSMRLKFWDETIERIYAGAPPNQPVALELAKLIPKHNLKKRQFLRLIKAREEQLGKSMFESLGKMEAYSEETVSPIMYLTLESAGIKDIHADHAASHIGKGQGLILLLRVVGNGGGNWGLPRDLLESAGVDVRLNILPNSESTRDIVYDIASRAKAHIDKAHTLKKNLPKAASVHLLPAVSTYNYLKRLRDANFDIFEPVLKERDARLGLSLIWARLINSY